MDENRIKEIIRQEIENVLGRYENIPYNVQEALRRRLGSGSVLTLSAKGVDTEDVSVNEAGSSSYAVMNDPDGFLQIDIKGTTYYIPYFG